MIRWIYACVFVLLSVSNAASQSGFQAPNIEPFGIDGFRLMLQQKGLDTVQVRLASAMRVPQETVIVLMGDVREALRIAPGLAQFVHDGGSLLVATDIGGPPTEGTKRMPWIFRSEFYSTRLTFASNHRVHRRYPDCPLVTQLDRSNEPDLFAGVQAIAANRPAYLRVRGNVRGIAWLPESMRPQREPMALVAAARVGKGRMLLVADHSVFINEMLIHADNARFASNVASWLTADGNRKQLVVCLDNGLLPEWSFVGKPPAIPLKDLLKSVERHGLAGLPPGDTILPILNQSIVDFEHQGGFHQLIDKLTGNSRHRGSRNMQKPLILVAILLLLLAMRWLVATRTRAQRWFFVQDRRLASETRLTAAVNEQNHMPLLRTLIREFFAEAGVTRFSEPEHYPQVRLQGSDRTEKTKVAAVRTLWDVATAASVKPMSTKRMETLLEQLRGLYQLHANGRLTLE